jgi:hypothetical protein
MTRGTRQRLLADHRDAGVAGARSHSPTLIVTWPLPHGLGKPPGKLYSRGRSGCGVGCAKALVHGGSRVSVGKTRHIPFQGSFTAEGCLTCGSGSRPGRQPTFSEPGGGYRRIPMPTLQCTSCGATYHTAATGPHLALAPLVYGCQSCGSREPLHIGVTRVCATEGKAREPGAPPDPGLRPRSAARSPGAA